MNIFSPSLWLKPFPKNQLTLIQFFSELLQHLILCSSFCPFYTGAATQSPGMASNGPCFPGSMTLGSLFPRQIKSGPVTGVSQQTAVLLIRSLKWIKPVLGTLGRLQPSSKNHYLLAVVPCVAIATSGNTELPFPYLLSGSQRPLQSVSFVPQHIAECYPHDTLSINKVK